MQLIQVLLIPLLLFWLLAAAAWKRLPVMTSFGGCKGVQVALRVLPNLAVCWWPWGCSGCPAAWRP